MSQLKNPNLKHSRYKECKNCGGRMNRSNSLNDLCWKCYRKACKADRICPKCNLLKNINEFTPSSTYCKKCLSIYTNNKWKKLKIDAVDYKGGKCERCGYNKCYGALEFHHKNPQEKDFCISKIRTLGLEKITSELDKCILLCANCHREIHLDAD